MAKDARIASRTRLHYRATITMGNQTSCIGQIVDLSLRCICLLTAAPVAAQDCCVSVKLPRKHGTKVVQGNGQVGYSDMQAVDFAPAYSATVSAPCARIPHYRWCCTF